MLKLDLNIDFSSYMTAEFLKMFDIDSWIEFHSFDGNSSVILKVIAFVDLSKAPRAKKLKSLISFVDYWPFLYKEKAFVFFFSQSEPLSVFNHLFISILQLFLGFIQFLSIKTNTFVKY